MNWVVSGYGKDKYGEIIGVIETFKFATGDYNDKRPAFRLRAHAKELFGVELEEVNKFAFVEDWEGGELVAECKAELRIDCREVKIISLYDTNGALISSVVGFG